jgi:hypothetical protein
LPVIYPCVYGQGWDEICFNQAWGIDSLLGGQSVFQMKTAKGAHKNSKESWASRFRRQEYRTQAQRAINNVPRCQADEFPMDSLQESQDAPQVVRLVDGPANGAQGRDFRMWKMASWTPCSILRSQNGLPPPLVTWAITDNGAVVRARTDSSHFVQKYGFDSQTPGAECWATYSHSVDHNDVTVLDHGFRALPDDPMFAVKNWPLRFYQSDPWVTVQQRGGLTSSYHPPLDVASASYLKRDLGDAAVYTDAKGVVDIDLQGMSVGDFLAANPDLEVMHLEDLLPRPREPPAVLAHATLSPVPTDTTGEHSVELSEPLADSHSPARETAAARKVHMHRHQRHAMH